MDLFWHAPMLFTSRDLVAPFCGPLLTLQGEAKQARLKRVEDASLFWLQSFLHPTLRFLPANCQQRRRSKKQPAESYLWKKWMTSSTIQMKVAAAITRAVANTRCWMPHSPLFKAPIPRKLRKLQTSKVDSAMEAQILTPLRLLA